MFFISFFLISVTLSGALLKPQFDRIEVFEVDLNTNQEEFQNNPLGQIQPSANPQAESTSCSSYWSYRNDFETWGLISIPEPSYQKNVVQITLSLAARLTTVR